MSSTKLLPLPDMVSRGCNLCEVGWVWALCRVRSEAADVFDLANVLKRRVGGV